MAEVRPQPLSGIPLTLSNPLGTEYATIKAGGVTERFTNQGPEAEVTFICPSHARTELLSRIFGTWTIAGTCNVSSPYASNGTTCLEQDYTYCCYAPEFDAQPYPFRSFTDAAFPYMWPDTYTMRPVRREDVVHTYQLIDDRIAPVSSLGNVQNSTDYGDTFNYYCQGALEQSYNQDIYRWDSSSVEIQVKYRWKIGALSLVSPFFGNRVTPPACMAPEDMLVVPANTFVEVRQRADSEIQQIEGKELRYAETQSIITGGTQEHDDGLGGIMVDNNNNVIMPNSPKELYAGVQVNTQHFDVIWKNVPQVPTWTYEELKGQVNALPFLGYPDESVLFVSYEATPKGNWAGQTVYDIRLVFIAKTATMPLLKSWSATEQALWYKGRIGLWNRRWSANAQRSPGCDGGTILNNWLPVVSGGSQTPYRATPDMGQVFNYNASCC